MDPMPITWDSLAIGAAAGRYGTVRTWRITSASLKLSDPHAFPDPLSPYPCPYRSLTPSPQCTWANPPEPSGPDRDLHRCAPCPKLPIKARESATSSRPRYLGKRSGCRLPPVGTETLDLSNAPRNPSASNDP